jgi:hypothetical protein
MTAPNFMIRDLLGALRAVALFPLFIFFASGYTAARLLNLFEFRRRTLGFRLALSAPLSISSCPMLVHASLDAGLFG